jgi:multisubunit Na+/H+ antiporter MnhE subunit
MRLLQYAVISLMMTIGWLMLTQQFNVIGFTIGYLLSFGMTAIILQDRKVVVNPANLPSQIVTLLIYSVVLARDIFLSGIDVVLRILNVRPVRPGIIAVKINDDDSVIAGLSAHGITITPGQLVVDFDDEGYLYVHCLDIEDSVPKVDAEQATRLTYLRGIWRREK